jgi:hypothetical protein
MPTGAYLSGRQYFFAHFLYDGLLFFQWVVRTRVLRLEDKYMTVIGSIPEIKYEKKPVPQEQLQREVDYIRAQRMLDSMLQSGLISLSEFNKITLLNRKSFSPALAQIMPEKR